MAMESVSTADARKNLAELMNRSAFGGERFVITRHGKEVAALVPAEDALLLERLRTLVPARDLEAALGEAEEQGAIAWSELRADLGL